MDSNTKPVKLCTKCKHMRQIVLPDMPRMKEYQCWHPNNIKGYSRVDGSPIIAIAYCEDMRDNSTPVGCTPEGNWWEEGVHEWMKPQLSTPSRRVVKSTDDLLKQLGADL